MRAMAGWRAGVFDLGCDASGYPSVVCSERDIRDVVVSRGGRRSTSFDSERAREAARKSAEARRLKRDVSVEEVAKELDLASWSMGRLRELAADDSNKAASVAALKELLARAPAPERDVGTHEPRGVLLSELLERGRDVRAEAVSVLAGAIAEGYDVDAIVTAASEQHASAESTVTTSPSAQPSKSAPPGRDQLGPQPSRSP
jgi:hypothetical protein